MAKKKNKRPVKTTAAGQQAPSAVPDSGQMQAEVKSNSVLAPPRRWWVHEVWEDQRENFKALIGHVMFFLLLISALALGGFVIDLTHLTAGQKEFLHQLDFIALCACLLVFSIGFIIEFAVLTARRIMHEHKQR